MKNLIKILVLPVIISLLSAYFIYKVKKESAGIGDIVDGGIVDSSYIAPKVIKSKDLIAIDTEFSYTEHSEDSGFARLNIKIERNEKNELILTEENKYKKSIKVGDEVLAGVQNIVEQFELYSLNGTVRYTSGLPKAYFPAHFEAEYVSGESIYFQLNGNPGEAWCNALAEYVFKIFEEYGENEIVTAG